MKPSEENKENLGCCEYINSKGRKTHLFQLFCDCNELDEYAETLLTHVSSSTEDDHHSSLPQVLFILQDRLLRFPFPKGARKITKDFLLPALFLPIIQFGAVSLFQSVLLNCLLFWGCLIGTQVTWYMWYRRSQIFFFSISILQCMHLWIYEYYLVGIINYRKIISFKENFVLLSLFFGCIGLVAHIRSYSSKHLLSGQVLGSKYCKICAAHVPGRDHHCIWLDACVSKSNTLSFYALLILSVGYLLDYALIGLSSICHPSGTSNGPVLIPSNDCQLDDFSNRMICLSSLNALVTTIPLVGICVFRCTRNVLW